MWVTVTSENHCRITSRLTKTDIHGNPNSILFLTAIVCPDPERKLAKIIINAQSAIFAKDVFSDFALWYHSSLCGITRRRCWHCDVIFVDCFASSRKFNLHWWITTVNIQFSQPGIQSLACKNWNYHISTVAVVHVYFKIDTFLLNGQS